MTNISMITSLLNGLLEVPVLSWDGRKSMLDQFEESFCFVKSGQSILSAGALKLLLDGIKPGEIYILPDICGPRIELFMAEGVKYVVGPFAEDTWTDEWGRQRMAKLHMPESYFSSYKTWYCRFSILPDEHVFQVIDTCLTSVLPGTPHFALSRLHGFTGGIPDTYYDTNIPDYDDAAERYDREKRFLDCVKNGQTQQALQAYARMEQNPATVEQFRSPRGRLIDAITAATIIRTELRWTALLSGVAPAVLNAITQSFIAKQNRAQSSDEIQLLIPQMITEITDAVHEKQSQRYSPAIAAVQDYIRMYYSQNLTLARLSERAGLSPKYLQKQFKEETGETMSQFIKTIRCEKAAQLLAGTSLPVQEISTYVGYLDSNYFVKVFRSLYHKTPTAYRETMQQRK